MKTKRFGRSLCPVMVIVGLICAQGVVAYKVGKPGDSVHEYIAEQARDLYSTSEIDAHFDQILDGTTHEDHKDHVYDRTGLCTWIDHYWNADNGLDDPVEIFSCSDGRNSWQKVQRLWGMALGEYASGDKSHSFEYLGHVVHLLSDMSVPAHAHEDLHVPGSIQDDSYEDWMTLHNAALNQSEREMLSDMGPIEIPDGTADPLFYLFYTTNQIGDFFPSDDCDGDIDDNWGGWMDEIYTNLGMYNITKPRTAHDLEDNDWGDDNNDGDLGVIRQNSFFYAIRAVAGLYKLFDENTNPNSVLTVVIEEVHELQGHGWLDTPDYYVEIGINGFWFVNEGDQQENDDIYPGWAFARNVGFTGQAEVVIMLWDDDYPWTADDHSDIDPDGKDRDLWLFVDLANGAISGDITGECGELLTSRGDESDRSEIKFRILLPDIPPTVYAGPDQTVDEGELVTLSGSFTDPNAEDTHTIEWDFGDGGYWSGTLTPSHTYGDDGVYTVTLTITDDDGRVGTDTFSVTVQNVAPSVDSLPSITINEAQTVSLTGHATDPGSDDLTFAWSWDHRGACDSSRTYLNDPLYDPDPYPSPSINPRDVSESRNCQYGDDGAFTVTLTVTDDDGSATAVTTTVTVNNVDPTIDPTVRAYVVVDVTLRVAGEKYHDVELTLHQSGTTWGTTSVTRYPGSPDIQAVTISDVAVDILACSSSAKVEYTPLDDPVNGQIRGATPAWVILTFEDGSEVWLNHTFNVNHPDTWVWTISDLCPYIDAVGLAIYFEATASDAGSDDLIFTWSWDDGTADTSTIYYNNGVSADHDPSPDVSPITETNTVTHAYTSSGMYNITLIVRDDDGGEAVKTISLTI